MTHALPLPLHPAPDASLSELLRQAMAGLLPTSGLNALLDRMERAA